MAPRLAAGPAVCSDRGVNPAPTPAERLGDRMRRSPVTAALVIAFAIVYVATWFDTDQRVFLTFAKLNERILAGEVWRLFTASFLHAGLTHIWFNSMALLAIGPGVERAYGKGRYLVIFLVGGAVGMAASVHFVPQPSVGASAGVFALMGVLLAYALRFRARLAPLARKVLIRELLFVVGLNVALGLLAGFIDNAAHLGGLAGGFLLGLLLVPRHDLFPPPPAMTEPPDELGAPPPDPSRSTPSIQARSSTVVGKRWLGWAGQRWKIVALFVGFAPLAISFLANDLALRAWGTLASAVGFGIAVSAKCPKCRVRVFWHCITKLPANRGIATALEAEACPVCGYANAS